MVTHQLQVKHRTAKAHRPKTNALPLDHATKLEAAVASSLQLTEYSVDIFYIIHINANECGCVALGRAPGDAQKEGRLAGRTDLEQDGSGAGKGRGVVAVS